MHDEGAIVETSEGQVIKDSVGSLQSVTSLPGLDSQPSVSADSAADCALARAWAFWA